MGRPEEEKEAVAEVAEQVSPRMLPARPAIRPVAGGAIILRSLRGNGLWG